MIKIGLLSCGKAKQDYPCPAREMYTSGLFRLGYRWLSLTCDRIYILSSHYNVLTPDKIIEPYESKLSDKSPEDLADWAQRIYVALRRHEKPRVRGGVFANTTIVWCAGREYKEPVQPYLADVVQYDPLDHLIDRRIGYRMQWLKEEIMRLEYAKQFEPSAPRKRKR